MSRDYCDALHESGSIQFTSYITDFRVTVTEREDFSPGSADSLKGGHSPIPNDSWQTAKTTLANLPSQGNGKHSSSKMAEGDCRDFLPERDRAEADDVELAGATFGADNDGFECKVDERRFADSFRSVNDGLPWSGDSALADCRKTLTLGTELAEV